MNRKRTKIYFISVCRNNNFIIYFIRFARYIMRANFYKFRDVDTLSNLQRFDFELHETCIVSNSKA